MMMRQTPTTAAHCMRPLPALTPASTGDKDSGVEKERRAEEAGRKANVGSLLRVEGRDAQWSKPESGFSLSLLT